jgi:tRNA pseudouridine38-40 synthase
VYLTHGRNPESGGGKERTLGARGLNLGTTRWLVRFGYDGLAFHGWARQPGARTVEGEILRGLVRHGIVSSGAEAALEVASRTDRGVSAVGNALAVSTERTGPILLRALNGISAEIFFTAASPLPDGFRVRQALRRVYRYFEPAAGHRLARWQEGAGLFAGRVDVRSLGRGLPLRVPVWRTVESVRVERSGESLRVEVRAPSFVWGMVRKIVAALRAMDRGQLAPAQVAAALAGGERLTLPMAEPEPLLLWNVEYPFPWELRWGGPNRRQTRWWKSSREALVGRENLLNALGQELETLGE